MTRTSILPFAAALIAATSLSGIAQAGAGVRLGFGGPLGTFVATPAHGANCHENSYGGSSMASKSYAKPSSKVARSAPREEPKVAKIDRSDDKPARTADRSEPEETKSKVETATSGTADNASELTGSKALATQDASQPTATETVPAATETKPATDPASTADATPANGTSETVVAAREETKEVVSKPVPAQDDTAKIDETRDVGCKKFVPAIGITVSVGCNK